MEKASESKKMSVAVSEAISIVAGPRGWQDTRESWLAMVPRRVRTVTFRTVKALWYGEIDKPDHWAARDIIREAEAIQVRRENAAVSQKLELYAEALNAKDPEFFEPDVASLRDLARRIGSVDSSDETCGDVRCAGQPHRR